MYKKFRRKLDLIVEYESFSFFSFFFFNIDASVLCLFFLFLYFLSRPARFVVRFDPSEKDNNAIYHTGEIVRRKRKILPYLSTMETAMSLSDNSV